MLLHPCSSTSSDEACQQCRANKQSEFEGGIYKPASDVLVVGKKLYVGEEDTMDETIDQGYVSIWDISDPKSPKFIKRLKAGKELPADFKVAHELYATRDGRYVYAQSW